MATPPTVQSQPLPPVPPALSEVLAATDYQWFVQLREKINTINATMASFSAISSPGVASYLIWDGTIFTDATVTTGVVAGSYTNTNLTVGSDGRISAASNGTGGAGGVLPIVTGEVAAGQPILVYIDDGSLVYAEVV